MGVDLIEPVPIPLTVVATGARLECQRFARWGRGAVRREVEPGQGLVCDVLVESRSESCIKDQVLPVGMDREGARRMAFVAAGAFELGSRALELGEMVDRRPLCDVLDRKSTRLNSSHRT